MKGTGSHFEREICKRQLRNGLRLQFQNVVANMGKEGLQQNTLPFPPKTNKQQQQQQQQILDRTLLDIREMEP